MLHHGRRDINGVGRNGHAFAPSEFHLKVHDHLSFNGQIKTQHLSRDWKGPHRKRLSIKPILYHLNA